MEHFTAQRLRFACQVAEPMQLNEHQGSAIRGAFYHALLNAFCMNREAASCTACPLVATCPVAFLVATLDPKSDRGATVPRPYTIEPPLDGKTRYAPGETLEFGLTMFARALNLFPYVVLGMQRLEQGGLGKRLPENGYRRGRFRVRAVWAENPLTGERQEVLRQGETMVQVPDVPITHAQVMQWVNQRMSEWTNERIGESANQQIGKSAKQCSGESGNEEIRESGTGLSPIANSKSAIRNSQLAIRFLTPTRLVDKGRLVHQPDFRVLMQRLLERLSALAREFGDTPLALDFGGLIRQAAAVQLVADDTRWVELESYSTRLGRSTPLGGFIGEATFTGDLAPFLPWLLWGQFTHVGKDAVKGNGWYAIIPFPRHTGAVNANMW
jgi:hypothetical protein